MSEPQSVQPSFLRTLSFDLFALVLPLIGLLPLLVLQVVQLWEKPHSRYLPFAWIGLALLVAVSPKSITTSKFRLILATASYVLALLAGCAAVAYFSPWTANLAAGFVFTGWALSRLEPVTSSRVLALSMLIFGTLPLPFGIDSQLSKSSVEKTVDFCSPVLDVFSIYHLYRSPVLSLKDQSYDVHELLANSLSIQPMVAIALFWSLIWKRSFFVALFGVISACVWAMVGKIIYLFTTAVFSYYEMDISNNYLGLLVLGITITIIILLIIGSDLFWSASFLPIRIGEESAEHRSVSANLFNRLVVWPGKLTVENTEELPTATSTTTRVADSTSGRLNWLVATVGLIMFALIIPTGMAIYKNDLIFNRASYLEIAAERLPDAAVFPDDFLVKQRQRQFLSNANSGVSNNQARSMVWNFSGSGIQTSILLRFPVRGWLNARYFLGPDWENQKTQLVNDSSNWPWSETTAQREGGLSTLILSTQIHTNGSPYSPNDDELRQADENVVPSNRWLNWRILALLNPKQETLKPQTFSVQLRYQSESSIKESEKKILVDKFIQVRKILTDRLLATENSSPQN